MESLGFDFWQGARHFCLGSTQPSIQWIKIKVHPIICHEGTKAEWRYSTTLSATSALDGGGCSVPVPCLFYPQENSITHCTRGWVVSRASEWVQKISPPRRFKPQTVQTTVTTLFWPMYSEQWRLFHSKVKWLGHETEHSSPPSAEVKNESYFFMVYTDILTLTVRQRHYMSDNRIQKLSITKIRDNKH